MKHNFVSRVKSLLSGVFLAGKHDLKKRGIRRFFHYLAFNWCGKKFRKYTSCIIMSSYLTESKYDLNVQECVTFTRNLGIMNGAARDVTLHYAATVGLYHLVQTL